MEHIETVDNRLAQVIVDESNYPIPGFFILSVDDDFTVFNFSWDGNQSQEDLEQLGHWDEDTPRHLSEQLNRYGYKIASTFQQI